MAINFKPINEVPEIEALSEGDKLLVNNGGTAKQIDASRVGGKGGGTVIYLKDFTEGTDISTASPCADAERTQVMSTAELLEAFAAGPVMLDFGDALGCPAWLHPCMTMYQDGMIISALYMGAQLALSYICSDMTT